MGKVDDKKQDKLTRLLDTAFELFTDQGIVKTTVSDITHRSGVAKGTFYLYFKDKYELNNKLITVRSRHIFRRAMEAAESRTYDSFEEWLLQVIDSILTQLSTEPMLLMFINKNLSWGLFKKVMLDDATENYLNIFYEKIRLDKNVTWDAPNLMLFSIIELVSSTAHSVILEKDPVDLEHFRPYLKLSVMNIIRAHQKPLNAENDAADPDVSSDEIGAAAETADDGSC